MISLGPLKRAFQKKSTIRDLGDESIGSHLELLETNAIYFVPPKMICSSGTSLGYYPIGEFDCVSLDENLLSNKAMCPYCRSWIDFHYFTNSLCSYGNELYGDYLPASATMPLLSPYLSL